MEVSAMSSSRFTQRMLATPNTPTRISSSSSSSLKRTLKNSLSVKASLSLSNSNNLSAPFVGGIHNNGGGSRGGSGRRGVVTGVNPYTRGNDWEQVPPDVASYLYKNRIVYLGMPLVPSVTELILAEFLYLQYDDAEKPIYLYVNSTGTTKNGEKLGYETEAFAIYDVMRYVTPPVYTLCLGNAWGEAALLLAAGAKGNRYALPSSSIMMKEPTGRFQGQATDIESARKDVNSIKKELSWKITAASKKLAECQETILSLGKQLKQLASPKQDVFVDKVVSTTPATAPKDKNLNRRSSLLNQMLDEDNVKSDNFKSHETKEIICTNVSSLAPLTGVSDSLYGLDNQVNNSQEMVVCSNASKYKGKAAAGQNLAVYNTRCGPGVSLMRKLVLRKSGRKKL